MDEIEIEYDEVKRLKILEERGLDLARGHEVFDGPEYTVVDDRKEYGEERFNTFGYLDDRLVALTWTVRENRHRFISMRKANDREQARFKRRVG